MDEIGVEVVKRVDRNQGALQPKNVKTMAKLLPVSLILVLVCEVKPMVPIRVIAGSTEQTIKSLLTYAIV